jgi:kinesin family member 4
MGTNHKDTLSESEIGVIPRAMNDIFHRITTSQTHSFEVKCSFIELYQENVYDLLSAKAREDTVVDIREDANKEIVIPGLTETRVMDAQQTISCLMKGSLGRATGATAMNSQSSRSHAIFTVTVQATPLDDETQTTSAKFHLVDLAGSERSKKTKATGVRFDEGVKINQGLLALGNVISALGSGGQGGHIKYRDSKLTRLLQDSLGGNSITLMIACVSPADNNYDETLSTLRYADRAKKIKNKPIVNQDPHVAEIKRLNAKILELQMQLYGGFENGTKEFNDAVNMRKRRVSAAFSPAGKLYALKTIDGQKSIDETVSLDQQVAQLTQKCRKLEVELQNSLNDVANYEMKSLMADEAVEKSLEKLKLMHELVTSDVDEEAATANRQKINDLLREMEELFEKYNDENKTNRLTCSSASGSPVSKSSGERDSMSSHEIVRDRHINKQVQLTNELRQVISNIALKEQLLSYVERQTEDGNQTVKDMLNSTYEDRIQKLEEELKEAKAREKKAKTQQISAKIAEERRRKVVDLEQQLNELKKQNRKQNKELQALGSKDKQVQTLSQEIVEARKERVRLVREMRKEAENFKRTQQDLNKEVNRIKEEDRKLKNEMIRKEKLHERQINVQKRKYDEIAVLNKRFKDALDRQVKAKLQRNERKGITKDFKSIVEHEMEVFRSVVDSKATIEHLLRERGELNQKLKQLKKEAAEEERNGVTAAETGESTLEQIKVLEDDIFMKNENIRALRDKIPADDHVKRLVDEFNDNVTSLVDSRQIIQKMVDYFAQAIQSSQEEKMRHLDTKSTNELMQDQINRLMAKYEELQQSYEVKNRQVERFYGDHLSLLLNNVNQRSRNGGGQAEEEAGNGMVKHAISQHFEALRNELDEYKAKYETLEAKYQKSKAPKKRYETRNSKDAEDEAFNISDEEDEEDDLNDSEADPSWRKTPMHKRRVSYLFHWV